MTDRLDGTVAPVTGAGRGIGREIALLQAEAGAAVAVLARTPREIEDTAALIERKGGRALASHRRSSSPGARLRSTARAAAL